RIISSVRWNDEESSFIVNSLTGVEGQDEAASKKLLEDSILLVKVLRLVKNKERPTMRYLFGVMNKAKEVIRETFKVKNTCSYGRV
ncbi:hypothetical protein EJ110_NYTH18097, partial [Nymphaea thermarum]